MFYIKLKYLREQANLTREQLAKILNITYQTLSKYETNQRQPDLITLKKIATYFNVTTDYLLDMPYSDNEMKNDIVIYFDLVKSIVNDSDSIYFKDRLLTDISKNFIFDSIEYISNQIDNINNEKT